MFIAKLTTTLLQTIGILLIAKIGINLLIPRTTRRAIKLIFKQIGLVIKKLNPYVILGVKALFRGLVSCIQLIVLAILPEKQKEAEAEVASNPQDNNEEAKCKDNVIPFPTLQGKEALTK